jgi:hypothetical protein
MSDQLDIIVREFGDLHAGIQSSTWVVENVGVVETDDRERVRDAFMAAFDLITSGSFSVTFSDELPTDPEY